jgi:phosphate starvation-inducible PhoH-like protein
MPRDSANEDFFDQPRRPSNRASRKAAAREERKTQKAVKAPVHRSEPLVPRNETQADYLAALHDSDQVFGIGPAGTGKTYMAARVGIRAVMDGRKEKICIARVTIAKKKHALGFRPGNQNDKIADWVVPIMDGFKAECSKTAIEAMVKAGKIEFLAFETLRGRSLEKCFVLLDEAQNCDLDDLKLFLTRIGDDTTVVVCGDPTQTDIPDSGLEQVLDMVDDYNIDADVIEFTEDDVVRSATAKAWVKAFSALS